MASVMLTAPFISHLLVKVRVGRAKEEILPSDPWLLNSKPALWQESVDINPLAFLLFLAIFISRHNKECFLPQEDSRGVKV